MSRALIALPRTATQKKENYTAQLVMALRDAGFTEGDYIRPFRVFEKGKYLVKMNMREGIVEFGGRFRTRLFKGDNYFKSIDHLNEQIEKLCANSVKQ